MKKPYFIMKHEEEKSAEVDLYGEVVEHVPTNYFTGQKIDGLFIELEQFLKDLDTLKEMDTITFHINSVGGDVAAGLSIFNRIRGLKAKVTTVVDGLAASAASIIAQSGDTRQVALGAQTMIHGASTLLLGYYNSGELTRIENGLEAVNKSIAGLYAERTGREEAEILRMMKKETWLTPKEAVENGFADEIIGMEEPVVDKVDGMEKLLIVNGILHNLGTAPVPDMAVRQVLSFDEVANGSKPSVIDQHFNEGRRRMNLQELKDKYPELVKELQEEATTAACTEQDAAVKAALDRDRLRMQEIDSIAQMVGDPALVHKAKYEEPMSASDLALKAMQAQQAAGASYMQARAEETKEAQNVTTPLNAGMEDSVAKDEAELKALLEYVKKEVR